MGCATLTFHSVQNIGQTSCSFRLALRQRGQSRIQSVQEVSLRDAHLQTPGRSCPHLRKLVADLSPDKKALQSVIEKTSPHDRTECLPPAPVQEGEVGLSVHVIAPSESCLCNFSEYAAQDQRPSAGYSGRCLHYLVFGFVPNPLPEHAMRIHALADSSPLHRRPGRDCSRNRSRRWGQGKRYSEQMPHLRVPVHTARTVDAASATCSVVQKLR